MSDNMDTVVCTEIGAWPTYCAKFGTGLLTLVERLALLEGCLGKAKGIECLSGDITSMTPTSAVQDSRHIQWVYTVTQGWPMK